jgi:hypothetical protein
MGDKKERETVSRRDVLKLAGTAAAFCTSFGFLQGGQSGTKVQNKGDLTEKHKYEMSDWTQAELKWYSGATLLHSSAIPARVAKHLASDPNATVEIKLFRGGQLLRNLGAIQGKH